MKKIYKNNFAITLIALVITIVILLILAGITISQLANNGLFGKSQEAKARSENAIAKEEIELAKYDNEINSYINGNRDTNVSYNYSLNEQVVGKWINNKPLYQRTIECNFGDNGSSAANVVYTDSTIPYEMVMIVSAIGVNSQGGLAYANLLGAVARTNDSDKVGVYYSQSMQAYMNGSELQVLFNHGTDRTAVKPIVTIQYTKTTDKATN